MRIALVADSFSVTEGTGIARYAHELRSGLIEAGLHVESVSPSPLRIPFGLALNHALKMPYAVARKTGDVDLVHAASPITALAFPLVSSPRVVTYHDLISLLCQNTTSALHTRLSAPLFLRIGGFADRIIANSALTKEDMVGHLGISAEKISVVPWGVSDRFKPQPRSGPGTCCVGYVGALHPRKGLSDLLRALSTLKAGHPGLPVKLAICGRKNQEYDRLVRLAVQLGVSQSIEFRGSVPDDELVDAYNSFDVFVLPSEWEGFGFPILEAQRCGVPVIIRKDAHIPEEVSACCLKASSEEDMADKIYELITDVALREEIIESALEYSQQFTWERTVRQTIQVYEQALTCRR
jgi:glycosyltransferase involved in cell wall biosynthesis